MHSHFNQQHSKDDKLQATNFQKEVTLVKDLFNLIFIGQKQLQKKMNAVNTNSKRSAPKRFGAPQCKDTSLVLNKCHLINKKNENNNWRLTGNW